MYNSRRHPSKLFGGLQDNGVLREDGRRGREREKKKREKILHLLSILRLPHSSPSPLRNFFFLTPIKPSP